MRDSRIAHLRRLAASTTFEGEREAALAKAAELEARPVPPPPPPSTRTPVSAPAEWPGWQPGVVTWSSSNTTNVVGGNAWVANIKIVFR